MPDYNISPWQQHKDAIKTVVISNGITNIGGMVFYDCTALTEIIVQAKLPSNVNSFGFYNVNLSIPVYVPQESLQAYKDAPVWKEFTNLQGKVF